MPLRVELRNVLLNCLSIGGGRPVYTSSYLKSNTQNHAASLRKETLLRRYCRQVVLLRCRPSSSAGRKTLRHRQVRLLWMDTLFFRTNFHLQTKPVRADRIIHKCYGGFCSIHPCARLIIIIIKFESSPPPIGLNRRRYCYCYDAPHPIMIIHPSSNCRLYSVAQK